MFTETYLSVLALRVCQFTTHIKEHLPKLADALYTTICFILSLQRTIPYRHI